MPVSTRLRSIFAAFAIGAAALAGTSAAQAAIIATPGCAAGVCTLTFDADFNTTATPASPFSFDVEVLFPYHLELLNGDSSAETVNFLSQGLFLFNSHTAGNPYDTTVEFKDMNGTVVAQYSFLNTNFANSGQGCSGCGTTASGLPAQILFHALTVTITPQNGALDIGTLETIQFVNFDSGSNVGEWPVPEPAPTALLALGLLALGWSRSWRR